MRRRFLSLALAGVGAGVLLVSAQAASVAPAIRIVKVSIVGGKLGQPGTIRFSPARVMRGTLKFEITNVDEHFHMFELNGSTSQPRWLRPGGKANATTTFTKPGRYFATSPDAGGMGISGILVVL
jgi:hypothetical protein